MHIDCFYLVTSSYDYRLAMIFVKIFIILFTPMHQTFVFLFERYMHIFYNYGIEIDRFCAV